MKRLVMFIPLVAFYLHSFSAGNENYVVLENNKAYSNASISANLTSESDRIVCKNIRLGSNYSKVFFENGEKIKVKTSEIKSFRLNDKLFQKLPLYENGKKTSQMIFMQLVGVKGGYNLFKYTKDVEGIEKSTGVYKSASPLNFYVVYRGDQYSYDVTGKNYQDVFKTFGVKMVDK